jgi:hypothetical protein
MNEKDTDPASGKGDLVPQQPQPGKTDLADIRSAEELLGKAFRALPDEQKQEIVKKAAETALELQAKKAHYAVEREEVEERLDLAGRAVRMTEQAKQADVHYEDEIRRQQGSTRIQVKSKHGPCFVATACFGNYDHPTVKVLRQFRDRELRPAPFGKALIALYYRHGRSLASVVERFPFLKPLLRKILNGFAQIYCHGTRRK